MTAGTRSVLFGVHCFLIHPFVVALGWFRAYGLRRVPIGTRITWARNPLGGWPVVRSRPEYASLFRPALWVAFIVHDLGLLGKADMDGPDGETHPTTGAAIMRALFGEPWGDFCLLHSRYYARRINRDVSPLCIADKWAIVVEPTWLYLPRAWASGELREYMQKGRERARQNGTYISIAERLDFLSGSALRWHRACRSYMRRWLAEHGDGRPDTWTPVRYPVAALRDPAGEY